jgi:copper chaperone CopZ
MGYYVHDVPGRLRVKIPLAKKRPDTAQQIEMLLKAIEGIDSTATNTTTGSVVINYNRKTLTSDRILSALNQNGWFDHSNVTKQDAVLQETVSKLGSVVSRALVGLVLEKTFEGSMLSLLTVLI